MKRCKEDVTALQLRLKKIVGQLNGVQKMLEADAPCEDIITQMNAANGALHRLSDEKMVAVQWECSGTFNGEAPFAGLQPNGRRFTTTVMNFYSFDANGKICKDVAATGIAGILSANW